MEYAFAIARAHGARIILLHVTKPISFCVDCGYGPVNRQLPDKLQSQKDQARLRKTAAQHLPPAFIEDALIGTGEPVEQILRSAEELKADLIVLYAHETNGSPSVGSHVVADQVARRAHCPVLVVRPHERDFVTAIPHRD